MRKAIRSLIYLLLAGFSLFSYSEKMEEPFTDVLAYMASNDRDPHKVKFYQTLMSAYPLIHGEKVIALYARKKEVFTLIRQVCREDQSSCQKSYQTQELENIYSSLMRQLSKAGKTEPLPKKITSYKGNPRLDIELDSDGAKVYLCYLLTMKNSKPYMTMLVSATPYAQHIEQLHDEASRLIAQDSSTLQ